ncbi:hypothetical protein FRC01_001138, partial [Tulasnella sp. 417]
MSSIMEIHSAYSSNSAQDTLCGYPEISLPDVATVLNLNTAHSTDNTTIQRSVSISTMVKDIRTTLLDHGLVSAPPMPVLIAMILSYRPRRSDEIRDIIMRVFPTDYKDKKAYGRLVENVKHNLTRCKCFVKGPRIRGMAGKGRVWSYDSS